MKALLAVNPVIEPYTVGGMGSCQTPGCSKKPTRQVSVRWKGWVKVACDDHALWLAVAPTLDACPNILARRCDIELHVAADCPKAA